MRISEKIMNSYENLRKSTESWKKS